MAPTARLRLAALALAIAAASGCGTTVDVSRLATSGAGANGSETLSVPSSDGPAATGQAVPGTTTTGAVAPGSGSTGAATGTATTVGAMGSSQGGPGASALAGPGITATTVTIGVETANQSAAADKAVGAAGAAPSYQYNDVVNAVIDYANAHGRFAGRTMKALYFDYNLTDDQSVQDQAACSYWTQDHKVFAIPGVSDVTRACAEKAGAVSLISGNSVSSTYKRFPHFVDPISIRLDRLGPMTVNGLYKAGYFTGPVGFITWDDPNYKDAYQHGYLPAMASHHLSFKDKAFVTVPQQVNALGDMSAAMSSIVTKFRSEGIDHVIIQDGHAGVWAGGGLTLEFMDQAESQRYFPRYGQNTDNLPGSAELPSDQQDKAIAIMDTDSSPKNDVGWHQNAQRELCFKIEADAGYPVSDSNDNDESLATQACDMVFFLQTVLNRMPANNLTSTAFVQAVAGLARSWPSATVYGTQFAPGLRDGSAEVRKAEYSASCSCLNYSGPPYYPS
jgi:hypothetical protein